MKITTLLFLLAFFSFLIPVPAQINQDSHIEVWNDESQPVVKRLEAISVVHLDKEGFTSPTSNPDTVFYHAQLQYDLAEANGLKYWMAKALTAQGVVLLDKNDHKEASEYFIKSLALAEEIGDKKLIARNSYNLGLGPFKEGDFASAFPYFHRAAKLFEELGEINLHAFSLDKIAFLYSQQGELKQSNEYLKQAISIREEIAQTDDSFRNKFILAGMQQTLKTHEAQLVLMDDNADSTGQAEANEKFNLAKDSMFLLMADKDKAFPQLRKKEDIEKAPQKKQDKNVTHYFGTVVSLTAKAQIHLDQKDTLEAIPFLEEAFKLAEKEKELNSAGWISLTLYQSYRATRQYKKSLRMFELAVLLRDSLKNMDNAKAIIEQQVKSDYEKQKAIDDLENEKQIAIEKQKKENQQKLSIAIGIGLLFISLLALVIFNRLKVTRKQKGIIEEQKKKVEQSEKYKEQFLANMSHEIRTPMHAISGMTNILVRKEHLNHQTKFLQAIKQSSRNLLVILNDILDLSKIEAGKIDIQSIPMNLHEVVLNVSDLLRVKAEEKGLSLHTNLAADIPEYIYGDPTRLNQILLNLLGNAIKFTEKGAVSLSVSTDVDKLRFAIKDSGIGIPADQLDTIFNSFEQVNDSITRKHGGTGLGLNISKQLVELQNGRIWVESQENIGSTFFFELPLLPVEVDKKFESHITEDQLKEMAASLSGLNILVVEDDELNSIIAGEDLEYYFKEVTIGYAENGQRAVQEFETGQYDLILMDIQMPELNGYDATQAIRKIEAAKGTENPIRIIAMTASLLKSEINNCYAAGMDNYIPKPYKPEELIGAIYEEVKK
jgi:signal transduction histidine kinase